MNITVYDSTGNRRVSVPVQVNDWVEWKRTGTAGSLRCLVDEVREAPQTIKLITPDERSTVVKASSRTFLALYRDGRRLP